jgi:hypothetical protein
VVTKPLVGFIYSEKATGNKDAVMDFNRVNDAEVTPNTPVISAPPSQQRLPYKRCCTSPLNGWTKLLNHFSHLNLGLCQSKDAHFL